MKRGLLISTCFPPVTQPEAVLSAKRMGNVPGWVFDVVAVASRRVTGDAAMARYAAEHFRRIARVPLPWPARPPSVLAWPLFSLPDPIVWARKAMVRATHAFGLESYDALVSWSSWQSSHLVALDLKRGAPRLPWLAHFSDPWSQNPYNRYGPLLRWLNLRLERQVLAAADALTFTNAETAKLMLADLPEATRRKAHIVPHAFDPALYPIAPLETGEAIVVRHLGYFYGRRSPRPLLDALRLLQTRQPNLLANVTVEFIGGFGRGHDLTEELQGLPAGSVRVCPPVDYVSSLALMRAADLLVAIDAPAEESVFLPSKLIDYIGAERPVLAITPPGAAAAVVDHLGGWRADPRDTQAVASAFEKALAYVRGACGRPFGNAIVREQYSVASIGRLTAEQLNGLIAGHLQAVG